MASKVHLPSHFRDWNGSSDPSILAAEKPAFRKPIWKRGWFIGVAAAVIVAIIVAIVVPLAVILPKKGKGKHEGNILLPLYVYPTNNASWVPLYNSLVAQPDVNFTVIINPSSGPGTSQYPDQQYTAALNQLATYSNVRKVGYVRTGYASRNLSDVLSDVNVYSGWASKSQAFAMDGIFFDESPHQYSAAAVQYMLSASQAVKNATGLQGSKMVIRNPGVIPDSGFNDTNTDVTVVFEESYSAYQTKESDLSTLSDGRSHHCYMVHSMPSMDKGTLQGFVDGLSQHAEYLFVTDNDKDYYETFGDDWTTFTDVVPS